MCDPVWFAGVFVCLFVSEHAASFEPWSSGSKEIKLQKHRSNDRRLPVVHRQRFMQMTWPERGLMGDHGSMTSFITGRVMKALPMQEACLRTPPCQELSFSLGGAYFCSICASGKKNTHDAPAGVIQLRTPALGPLSRRPRQN